MITLNDFFSQVHFYIKSDILIACMDIQLRIFKLNAMLTNAFNVGGVQGQNLPRRRGGSCMGGAPGSSRDLDFFNLEDGR